MKEGDEEVVENALRYTIFAESYGSARRAELDISGNFPLDRPTIRAEQVSTNMLGLGLVHKNEMADIQGLKKWICVLS